MIEPPVDARHERCDPCPNPRDRRNPPTPSVEVRHDWRLEEIRAVYGLPLLDLVFRAATVHRRCHASNEVPANVLREVQDWSNWVRQVTAATLTVLRCPDRDTADRVMGAMKRQAERVNDTLIALDQKKLTAAERGKLLGHGIIVEGEPGAQERKSKARKKRW